MDLLAHLTDELLTRYRNRTLTPVELIDLDEHISACAPCRDRLYTDSRASAAIKSLRSEFSIHLEYADIVSCSEGQGKPQHLLHLRECATCQAEVQDLSRFRTEMVELPRKPLEMPKRPWVRFRIPLGIAASLLLVAGGTSVVLRLTGKRAAPPAPVAVERPDPALPAPERRALELALANQRFDRAPVLENLIARPGTLLGGAKPAKALELIGPVGTTVVADHPVFLWTPAEGALSYVVAVFDDKFQKVAESPVLTATEWRSTNALPRGQVLSWQVTVKTRNGVAHAPAPPAPEARFLVLASDVVDHIEGIRRDHPGSPLLLAVLYANVGALDEAMSLLRAADPSTAQPFRESIEKIRRAE